MSEADWVYVFIQAQLCSFEIRGTPRERPKDSTADNRTRRVSMVFQDKTLKLIRPGKELEIQIKREALVSMILSNRYTIAIDATEILLILEASETLLQV
jgi:hypothetical protein